jgi:Protein of unknown function (DUF3261)
VILFVASAMARPPDAVPPPAAEHVQLFVLSGHGHAFGGTAIVVHESDTVVLEALSPAGPSLFTARVEGAEAQVEAIDPGLAQVLGRIPFARDLTALYLVDGARRERTSGWTVRPTDDGWRVSGPGGGARIRRVAGGLELRDRLRGYTLTVTELL